MQNLAFLLIQNNNGPSKTELRFVISHIDAEVVRECNTLKWLESIANDGKRLKVENIRYAGKQQRISKWVFQSFYRNM